MVTDGLAAPDRWRKYIEQVAVGECAHRPLDSSILNSQLLDGNSILRYDRGVQISGKLTGSGGLVPVKQHILLSLSPC